MKNLVFTSFFLPAFVAASFAQPGQKREDKIEAFKIAFFTERLQLTPEESKTFWPIFNQFENERDALKDKFDLDSQNLELMSDKDVEAAITQHLDMEEQMVKLRRDYIRRFKEVLPIRKVAMLQRIDNDFKRALLEEIKKRREARQGGGGPGPRRN